MRRLLLLCFVPLLAAISCTPSDTSTVTGELRVLQGVATITLCDSLQRFTLRQGGQWDDLIAGYEERTKRPGDGSMVKVTLVPADYLNEGGSQWIKAWEVKQYAFTDIPACHTVDGSNMAGRYEGIADNGDKVMVVLGFNGNALLRTMVNGNNTTEPGTWKNLDNETLQIVCNLADTIQFRYTWDAMLVEEYGRYGAGGMVLTKGRSSE